METKEDAYTAMAAVHDMIFQDTKLLVCMALLPGKNLHLYKGLKGMGLAKSLTTEHPQADLASLHRHPSPVQPQSNVPSIALPIPKSPLTARKVSPQLTIKVPDLDIGQRSPALPPKSPFPDEQTVAGASGDTTPVTAVFTTQVSTWANIAGAATPSTRLIDLHPEKEKAPRLHPVGRIPSVSNPKYAEPLTEQMRVVFCLNLPNNITLTDISDAVREGPVLALRMGVNNDDGKRFVGIIFQFATDAEKFFQVLIKERVDSAPQRFRFIVDVARGEPFPADENLRAMNPPTYATRRLTLVKKAFFFAFTERHLKQFCEKHVGAEHIQLIFIYNGGNATIVFAEVAGAIKVKKELEKKRDNAQNRLEGEGSLFQGLGVSFSKDPCELGEPLNLQSVMYE